MEDSLINKELVDEILNHDNGVVKSASAAASKVTRTKVREDGFHDSILPFEDINNERLDYQGDSELPGVWYELEPDSPAAKSLPFNGTPDTAFYRAEKYIVLLGKVSTEEMTKNVNELRTYKSDVRQIVQDNLLRDISVAEDSTLITQSDRLVGAAVAIAAATVNSQNVVMGADTSPADDGYLINRSNYKRMVSFLTDRDLPHGVTLMNNRTAQEFLGFKREDIGGDLAQTLFTDGLKAMSQFKIFGLPHLATIKRDLVANGVCYQFAPQNFLGHALRLEDVKVTIKKEDDIVRFRADEIIGATIGNTRAIQKVAWRLAPVA